MTTTWTIAIDWDRNGNFTGTYDDVTERAHSINWFLGARQPYQDSVDNSKLELILNNVDKHFSPENTSSPLTGNLAPFRPVRVQSNDGTTTRTHWTGWIETISPDVGQYGERKVKITAAGPMQFFKGKETSIQVQENKRTDEIIQQLIEEVQIPPQLNRTTLLGVTGYSELGVNTYLPDMTIDYSLEQGLTTLAYAADNWIRQDDKEATFNVYRAISDTVAAERGRFIFNRAGQAVFWNRHHLLTDTDIDASFDNTMTGLDYNFAGLDEFKNEVKVSCHPRTISSGEAILWSLDEPVTVQPDGVRTIGASYTDDSENRIGGKDVRLSGVVFSEGTGGISIEAGANRATITVYNHSKTENLVLSECEIRGTKITDFGRMDAVAVDNESIAYYGQRTMSMNLPSVDNLDYAQTIADFELGRRSTPTGKVSTLTLRSHGENGGNQHTEQLARTLGDRIEILEEQTQHDGQYFIIGEAHKLSDGGTMYETTWYLESASEGGWLILADGTENPQINDLSGAYRLAY